MRKNAPVWPVQERPDSGHLLLAATQGTATEGECEKVRLRDGHMRARAMIELGGRLKLMLADGEVVEFSAGADGAVSGTRRDGRPVILSL